MTARCDDDFELDPRTGRGIGCARCAQGGGVLPATSDSDLLIATGPSVEAEVRDILRRLLAVGDARRAMPPHRPGVGALRMHP